jgi:hypothetical protein
VKDQASDGGPLRGFARPARDAVPFVGIVGFIAAGTIALASVAFMMVTTFVGDDHLFLAFARYAPNPFSAFVHDQHGGEFYRPLPMVLWWILGRAAQGSRFPFALLSFALHLVASLQVGSLVVARHRDERTVEDIRAGIIAAWLFFLAPITQEAAFWYSASTDLLATVFGLAAVGSLLRDRPWSAALFFAAACSSKESALVVPLLAAVALRAQGPRSAWSSAARRVVCLLPVGALYAFVRSAVLGGLGRSGDVSATLVGKVVQIISGLGHAVFGSVVSHGGLAWSLGCATWGLLALGGLRLRRSAPRASVTFIAPILWMLFAVAPLLAASWVVGARYFYLPMVGVAWLAAEILARARVVVVVGVLAALAGLDLAQAVGRRAEIVSYEARLSAVRRAVADGLRQGFDTFHVAAGIKDLDLAVKEDARFRDHESDLVVLDDVPESFVALPDGRARELDFLLARPAIPPSGAYRFGARRVVGLARRGDDPTLDEVVARLPDIRFIRLRLAAGGLVIPRDVTEALLNTDDNSE